MIHENERIPYGKAFGRLSASQPTTGCTTTFPTKVADSLGKSLFTSLHAFYRHWRAQDPVPLISTRTTYWAGTWDWSF